jgi:hypothetical protein
MGIYDAKGQVHVMGSCYKFKLVKFGLPTKKFCLACQIKRTLRVLSFDSGNHKFGKINKLLNLGKE